MKEAIIQYNDIPSGGYMAISWKPLVRCKDCKFSRESYTPHILLWCDKNNKHCTFDWFCADGVKKDDSK